MEGFERQEEYGTYNNGTKYVRNANNDVMHQCQYCDTWFLPKRRFVQKFCSESCRVLACKKRKVGMYGVDAGRVHDRSNVTNQALVNQIQSQSSEMRDQYREIHRLQSEIDELKRMISDQGDKTREKVEHEGDRADRSNDLVVENLQNIKKKQEWDLLLTTILPFLAPYIQKRITKAKNDENKNAKEVLDELQGYTDLFADDMPENYKKNMDSIKAIIDQAASKE